MKKLLALLLAVLMCVTLLAGCKKEEQNDNSGGGTVDTTDPNRIPPEIYDYEGYTFKIRNDYWEDYEICVPKEMTGEGINDTIYQRNKNLEALYNITLEQTAETKFEDRTPIRDRVFIIGPHLMDPAAGAIGKFSFFSGGEE